MVLILTLKSENTDITYKIYSDKVDVSNEPGGRIPPGTILGQTSNAGKQVGFYDFLVWLYNKNHTKATSTPLPTNK